MENKRAGQEVGLVWLFKRNTNRNIHTHITNAKKRYVYNLKTQEEIRTFVRNVYKVIHINSVCSVGLLLVAFSFTQNTLSLFLLFSLLTFDLT